MSKRAGAVSEETREGILTAAKAEFSAKGFAGASLRRICGAAGVTTGALYFLFQGKDDLFRQVLAQVTEPFLYALRGHYAGERSPRHEGEPIREDLEISAVLIDCYFANRPVWDILRTNLDHPAVQEFLDCFMEESTEHYERMLTAAAGETPISVDHFAIHQFVHMQADTMLNLIAHDFTREEMVRHSGTVVKMLRAAFDSLLKEK